LAHNGLCCAGVYSVEVDNSGLTLALSHPPAVFCLAPEVRTGPRLASRLKSISHLNRGAKYKLLGILDPHAHKTLFADGRTPADSRISPSLLKQIPSTPYFRCRARRCRRQSNSSVNIGVNRRFPGVDHVSNQVDGKDAGATPKATIPLSDPSTQRVGGPLDST